MARPRFASRLERNSGNCSGIPAVTDVVSAFVWAEGVDEFPDGGPQPLHRSFGGGSDQPFQLGEGVLDGVEVRTVRGQVQVIDAATRQGGLNRRRLVRGEVVEDEQVAGASLLGQHLLDVGRERGGVHGAIEDHWCDESLGRESTDEGRRFPVAVRHGGDQALTAWGVAVETGHVGGNPGFVQENQSLCRSILDRDVPLLPGRLDVLAFSLLGVDRLFLNVRPRATKARHTVTTEVVSWSRSRTSAGDRSGCSALRVRMRSWCSASAGLGPRRPDLGASDPPSRWRCRSRRTNAGLTSNRSATSAVVSPDSRAW